MTRRHGILGSRHLAALRVKAAVLVPLAGLLLSPSLAAQCVMCAKNAEYAGGDAGASYGPLLTGAVILLVPTVAIMVGAVVLTLKFKDASGAAQQSSDS